MGILAKGGVYIALQYSRRVLSSHVHFEKGVGTRIGGPGCLDIGRRDWLLPGGEACNA